MEKRRPKNGRNNPNNFERERERERERENTDEKEKICGNRKDTDREEIGAKLKEDFIALHWRKYIQGRMVSIVIFYLVATITRRRRRRQRALVQS